MRKVKAQEAIGMVLGHDVTRIIPGKFKGAVLKKGHIIQEEDIPVLLDTGNDYIYVLELPEGELHEDDAGMRLAQAIARALSRDLEEVGIYGRRGITGERSAEEIGMHESTVSRVVNNKYMHTHRGLFEMRFFFHSGIASTRGAATVSSLTVKDKIRKIIEAEDASRPLSDSAIVKMLKNDGLQIARRTVAKYREELKIPSSSNRRRALQ